MLRRDCEKVFAEGVWNNCKTLAAIFWKQNSLDLEYVADRPKGLIFPVQLLKNTTN